MPLDDELPMPPTGTAVAEDTGVAEADFSGEANASDFAEVPGMNEPIPQGTYHYRLHSYKKVVDKDGQPRFDSQWSCQQEPHTGRRLMDFIGWVSAETFAAARAGDAAAKDIVKKRLPRAKELMAAAGYKPVGAFNFETDFLATNPEVKIPTTVTQRMNKDERAEVDGQPNPNFGKYKIPTGINQNGLPNSYLPLNRPS